jgi:Cu/Ag efflux protein CusF
MKTKLVLPILALCVAAAAFAAEPAKPQQKKKPNPVTQTRTETTKATIEAIEHDARLVTLKNDAGDYETIYVSPNIKRFDELQVGQTVTFKYTEAVVYELHKAGEAAPASSVSKQKVESHNTPKPSGTVSQKETATVTVKAADAKTGALTVTTEDGHTTSLLVKDKNKLQHVQPGDKIVITYTDALAVSVE